MVATDNDNDPAGPMQTKINKSKIDATDAKDKDVWLWDTDVKGFGVRCRKRTAKGKLGSKTYFLKHGTGNDQQWIRIGVHGSPWTVDAARKEALRLLGLFVAGENPAHVRDDKKRDLTISKLCEIYLEEGCAHKKPTTVQIDAGRIKRHIEPLLGRKKVGDLDRRDVDRFLKDVADGKTAADERTKPRGRAIVRGGKGTANKAVALLSAAFSFAVDREIVDRNPVLGIKKYREGRSERYLAAAELERLGEALKSAEKRELPGALTAIRLLALTGARRGEILSARWEYVDFERSLMILPDSKTGHKVLLLGAPALEVLENAVRIKGNPFICPGASPGKSVVNIQKVWNRIRNDAGIPDVRLHDLRHSFASVSAAEGDSLLVIGKLLGHANQSTTQRYAHLADDPLRLAADKTAGRIAAMMNGDQELLKSSDKNRMVGGEPE
jgi:integrase